eukprot:1543852-Amphidinium_carterae.1
MDIDSVIDNSGSGNHKLNYLTHVMQILQYLFRAGNPPRFDGTVACTTSDKIVPSRQSPAHRQSP